MKNLIYIIIGIICLPIILKLALLIIGLGLYLLPWLLVVALVTLVVKAVWNSDNNTN